MKINKYKIWLYATLLLASISCLIGIDVRIKRLTSEELMMEKVATSIENISKNQDEIENYMLNDSLILDIYMPSFDIKKRNDVIVHIYDSLNNLEHWNSNIVNTKEILAQGLPRDSILFLQNGYYYVTGFKINTKKVLLLNLLYSTPIKQNEYLYSEFIPAKLYGFYEFSLDKDNQIVIQPQQEVPINDAAWILLLTVITMSLFLMLIYNLLEYYIHNNKYVFYVLFTLGCIVLIFMQQVLHDKCLIFQSDLYLTNNVFLADLSWSLGDFSETIVALCGNIIVLFLIFKSRKSKWTRLLRNSVGSGLFVITFLYYINCIETLISNTDIPLTFSNIAHLKPDSYIFITIISIITLLILIIERLLIRYFFRRKEKTIFPLIITSFFALISIICGVEWYIALSGIIMFALYIIQYQKHINFNFASILIIVCISIELTYLFSQDEKSKKKDAMMNLAQIAANESDPRLENTFKIISDFIQTDSIIKQWASEDNYPSDDSVLNYLLEKNPNPIINYYNIVLTWCTTNQELMIEPDNIIIGCDEHFGNIIFDNRHTLVDTGLFLIDFPSPDPYYLGIISFLDADSAQISTLYIEFVEKNTWNGLNVPQLLIDADSRFALELQDYSFACYNNNVLVYKYGQYLYSNYRSYFPIDSTGFFPRNNYLHYCLDVDDLKSVVISCEITKWFYDIAPFSFLFIIIIILYLVLFSISIKTGKRKSKYQISFRYKLQAVTLSSVLLSFFIIGTVSVFFIRNIFEQQSDETQFETTRSIMTSMRNELDEDLMTKDKQTLTDLLEQYSIIFSTDIHLFDTNGTLIASSRPEMFLQGLVSNQIDKEAYENIHWRKRLYYSHYEYLFSEKFKSAYIPLRNLDGDAFAYINLPNYTTKSVINNKLINFIIAYINIFIVIILISSLFILILSQRVTKPLILIQEKMKDIRLGQKNQPIKWRSRDEIGQLIRQYNILLKELERSAQLLARSERETAWRDMARQVAHEIKNPLTPMRLSIQFLQMSWNEKDPDIDKKIRETSATLIEQIDSLSAIASAFSDYARLPHNTIEKLDLIEILLNTVHLYDKNNNIDFKFELDHLTELFIESDKNNLNRAIGNIIKNAVQAIGDKPDGIIEIEINNGDESLRLSIKDNGPGIDDEIKSKVFLPNFTTKSSGMGVGLSITRNIIESLGGYIDFESTLGTGTTFIINLPHVAQNTKVK